jgi:hypothetical protein
MAGLWKLNPDQCPGEENAIGIGQLEDKFEFDNVMGNALTLSIKGREGEIYMLTMGELRADELAQTICNFIGKQYKPKRK